MRIAVFCSVDHFHAPIVLREIGMQRKADSIFVFATPKLSPRKKFIFSLRDLLKASGADYIFSMAFAKTCFLLLSVFERYILRRHFEERRYFTINETIRHFALNHYFVKDINSRENIGLLSKIRPDVIVAIFFNQILKKPVLGLAPLSVNLHPSFLPEYRGFSPVFWVLANNESYGGVAIHALEEGIDEGPIILREKITVHPQDSFFSLYRKSALAGAGLLIKALDMVQSGKLNFIGEEEKKSSYCSRITPSSVRGFRKNKRKFFKFI